MRTGRKCVLQSRNLRRVIPGSKIVASLSKLISEPILGLAILFVLAMPMKANAFVFIHELLADPASGLAGDANNDGVRDSYDDEFLELFNLSSESVDISNWHLTDAVTTRHVFGSGSLIDANSALVVFGGGLPSLTGIKWQLASAGALNLNNSGDTITLFDLNNVAIDSVVYGSEGGDNQSLSRNPEGSKGEWIKHMQLLNADGNRFSPGYLVNEIELSQEDDKNDFPEQSTVPEPSSRMTLILAGTGWIMKKRWA